MVRCGGTSPGGPPSGRRVGQWSMTLAVMWRNIASGSGASHTTRSSNHLASVKLESERRHGLEDRREG